MVYSTTYVSVDPITEEEVMKTIQKLKNWTTAGVDQVQPVLLKYTLTVIPPLTILPSPLLLKLNVVKYFP